MPRLSQTLSFLQNPSFQQVQSALIGQLTQSIGQLTQCIEQSIANTWTNSKTYLLGVSKN